MITLINYNFKSKYEERSKVLNTVRLHIEFLKKNIIRTLNTYLKHRQIVEYNSYCESYKRVFEHLIKIDNHRKEHCSIYHVYVYNHYYKAPNCYEFNDDVGLDLV